MGETTRGRIGGSFGLRTCCFSSICNGDTLFYAFIGFVITFILDTSIMMDKNVV
jgi:hypothetical protein